MPVAVPGRLQRVDPEHHIPGRDQRLHPQAPVGLDPDPHLLSLSLSVVAELLADHRVQPGHPRRALRQPGPGQHPPRLIHQLDVVMILSPVISCEKQRVSRPGQQPASAARGRTISDLINECSRRAGGHDIPAAIYSPGHQRGHDLSPGLPEGAQGGQVLTRRRLPDPSLPQGRPVNSY